MLGGRSGRMFDKKLPPTEKLLMLMLGQIHTELQQMKQQAAKDKKEILEAIWAQGLLSGK